MATRGRKAKSETQSAAKSLQAALKFCSIAFKAIGAPYQVHCVMHQRWMYAFDGVLAAGHVIDDELTCAPHGARLMAALDRPGAGLAMALAGDGGHLAVKLAGFRAKVPCASLATIAPFGPDPVRMAIDSRLQVGCGDVAHLASNSGTTVLESSILIDGNILVATNRVVVMEYAHGLAIPGAFVVPRVFATAVWKCGKPAVGLGWSDRTLTVHYADHSWIRTQLYIEAWPSLNAVFAAMNDAAAVKLPENFFDVCETLAPFVGEKDTLFVGTNNVSTAINIDQADAVQVCKGLDPDITIALPCKLLKHIAGRVDKVDWTGAENAAHFYGDNLRVAIMRRDIGEVVPAAVIEEGEAEMEGDDTDHGDPDEMDAAA